MGSDKIDSKTAQELDSTPYSTTVSAALSASAQLIQPGDALGTPAAVMAEVLQVNTHYFLVGGEVIIKSNGLDF